MDRPKNDVPARGYWSSRGPATGLWGEGFSVLPKKLDELKLGLPIAAYYTDTSNNLNMSPIRNGVAMNRPRVKCTVARDDIMNDQIADKWLLIDTKLVRSSPFYTMGDNKEKTGVEVKHVKTGREWSGAPKNEMAIGLSMFLKMTMVSCRGCEVRRFSLFRLEI